MARVGWLIEGEAFGNCNCDYGCPCQFEGRLNQGNCPGFEAFRIDAGRPIKSPATGQDRRVRIDIPNGIEFELAEIGSASATAAGAVPFALKDSYSQFYRLKHSGGGVVHQG